MTTAEKTKAMSYWQPLIVSGIIIAVLIGNGALIAWPWSIVAGPWVWLILLSVSFVPVIIWLVLLIAACIADISNGWK